MSKEENGDWDTWDGNSFGNGGEGYDWTSGDGEKQLEWLQKYVLPYMKVTETTTKGKYAIVGLPNGTGFSNYNQIYFFCLKFKDCKEVTETWNSRDRFIFEFSNRKGFITYGGNYSSREAIMNGNGSDHACNKTKGKGLCAKLIEYDGWEIRKDYPW